MLLNMYYLQIAFNVRQKNKVKSELLINIVKIAPAPIIINELSC